MTTALVKKTAPMEIEAGRFVWVQPHPFSAVTRQWVPQDYTLQDIVSDTFPQDAIHPHVAVKVDGQLVDHSDWNAIPHRSSLIEVFLVAEKGVLRAFIRAVVVFAVTFVATYLFGPTVGAWVGRTVGVFLGNLLANALVPPSRPDDGRLDAPKVYSIEGVRNQIRIGQPVPFVLGTRRVFADVIVPFHQVIIGEDVYLVGAVCWAFQDVTVSELKNGDTLMNDFEGLLVQHSLKESDPSPTLIRGLPTPVSVGSSLEDNGWVTRTSAPNAEQIDILLYFPQGIGRMTKKGKKKSHTVSIEVRYREVAGGGVTPSYRTGTAADPEEAETLSRDVLGFGLRELHGNYGHGYSNQYHTALGSGGRVALNRSFTRSAPGEPFFASVSFAVPPGKQYDIEVRRSSSVTNDDEYFDEINWSAMTSFAPGDPFPNPKAAVTALRYKATDEVSGVLDTINGRVSNLVRTYSAPGAGPDDTVPANFNGWETSSNGADQLLHVAVGTHQANPTPDDEIDWPAMGRFWEWCDLNNFTFDFVDTSGRRKGDIMQLIGSACRARILRINGRLTPVIDGPQPQGPRTILSPDNARDFKFHKIFPADVHALRVKFVNKNTGYRNDERYLFLNGHTKETATKYEDFSLPGVVDPDLIFQHAHYFIRTQELQTLSGSCVQDIEGSIILRYGNRVRIRHSTLQMTGESGRVLSVTKNEAQQVTGFKLSEFVTLSATDSYVARWRKIGTDAEGHLYVSAGDTHLATVSADFGGQTEITTNSFTFDAPVDGPFAPEEDAILVVGLLGEETVDALVKGVTPVDEAGRYYRIDWTLYAEERFANVETPPHDPLLPPVFNARPLPVTIESWSANNEGIFVGFSVASVAGAIITGFDIWSRETPENGADTPWHEQPTLPASARTVTLPPGRPGQSFDVKIVTKGTNDLRSDPALQTDLLSFEAVPAPENPVVAAAVRQLSGGAQIPVIAVSVDRPDDPALFETLVIELKKSSETDWIVATTAPADNPAKDITSVTPGESHDVRLSWRNIRGAITLNADRPIISSIQVSQLVADDTVNVGGTPSTEITGKIVLAEQNISALSDAQDDLSTQLSIADAARQAGDQALTGSLSVVTQNLQTETDARLAADGAINASLAQLDSEVDSHGNRLTTVETSSADHAGRISLVETSTRDLGRLSIPSGIPYNAVGHLDIMINSTDGITQGGNANHDAEMYLLEGHFDHPETGNTVTLTPGLIQFSDGSDVPEERFFLMYSSEVVSARFGGALGSCPNVMPVIFEGGDWKAVDNSYTKTSFTPLPTDRLIAVVEKRDGIPRLEAWRSLIVENGATSNRILTVETTSALQAQRITDVETRSDELVRLSVPTGLGYGATGSLDIVLNSSNGISGGGAGDGEFWVNGDFNHPITDQTITLSGFCHTPYDAALAPPENRLFAMYSAETVSTRFGGTLGSEAHLICVIYRDGQWKAVDNNNTETVFTPLDTDWLIASIENYENETALKNLRSFVFENGPTVNRITSVETTTANHATRLSNVETTTDDHESRVTIVEATSSNHANRLTNVETVSADHEARVTSVETASADHAGRITNVETTTDDLSRLSVPIGIPYGVTGHLDIVLNSNNGVDNSGGGDAEMYLLEGHFDHPETKQTVTLGVGTILFNDGLDPPNEQFFLMYSEQAISTRFSGSFGSSQNIVPVIHDGSAWKYVPNSGVQTAFTPADTDILLAIVEKRSGQGVLHDQRSLVVETSATTNRVTSVETTSLDHASRLTNVEAVNANHESRILTTETTDANHASRLTVVETATNDLLSRALPPGLSANLTGDLRFYRNATTQLVEDSNLGEIAWGTGYIDHPVLGRVSISQSYALTPYDGTTPPPNNVFYLMFTNQTNVSRWPGSNMHDHHIATVIFENGQWKAIDNSGVTYPFTPIETDALLLIAQKDTSAGIKSIVSLLNYTGEIHSSIETLETTSGSHASRLTNVETTSGQNTANVASLQATSDNHATQLTSLNTTTASHSATIANLNTASNDQATQIERLNFVSRSGSPDSIPDGIVVGAVTDCQFFKNKTGGGSDNIGEIEVTAGTLKHPSLGNVSIIAGTVETPWEGSGYPDTENNEFYIMFSVEDPATRFPNNGNVNNHPKLLNVIYDGAWKAVVNSGPPETFVPLSTDIIIGVGRKVPSDTGLTELIAPLSSASGSEIINLNSVTADHATRLSTVETNLDFGIPDGITVGLPATVTVSKNFITASSPNDGEFWVTSGTFFHPDGNVTTESDRVLSAMEGSGVIAEGDGRFFMMFTVQDVISRFGSAFNTSDHPHLLLVRHDGTNWKWLYNSTRVGTNFSPVASDRIVGIGTKDASTTGITSFTPIFFDYATSDMMAQVAEVASATNQINGYLTSTYGVRTTAGGALGSLSIRSVDTGEVSFSEIELSADRLVYEADGEVIWYSDAGGLTLKKALRWVAGGTATNPDTMYVLGLGFGANNDLMEWFGPFAATVDGCTKTNSVRAKTIDGKTYLNGVQEGNSPITASDSTTGTVAELTSIGANGNTTEATMSYSRSGTQHYWSASNPGNGSYSLGSATVQLWRKEGSGSYVKEQEFTVSGTVTRTVGPYDYEFDAYPVSQHFIMGKTFTHQEQSNAAHTYSWKTVLSSESGVPSGTGWNTSRVVSISIFEPAN